MFSTRPENAFAKTGFVSGAHTASVQPARGPKIARPARNPFLGSRSVGHPV